MSTTATSGLCRARPQQLVGGAGLADDLKAGVGEQARNALAKENGVFADRLRAWDRARTVVPRRAG